MESKEGEAAAPAAVAAAGDVIDAGTKRTVQRIPLLTVRAGPRDGARWVDRLKEEYTALIQASGARCLSWLCCAGVMTIEATVYQDQQGERQ
jgi:hypothetical protein